MSAITSKCYRNRAGFGDYTDFVEVLSDDTSIIHNNSGQQDHVAHDFRRPIASGDWIEVDPPGRAYAKAGVA